MKFTTAHILIGIWSLASSISGTSDRHSHELISRDDLDISLSSSTSRLVKRRGSESLGSPSDRPNSRLNEAGQRGRDVPTTPLSRTSSASEESQQQQQQQDPRWTSATDRSRAQSPPRQGGRPLTEDRFNDGIFRLADHLTQSNRILVDHLEQTRRADRDYHQSMLTMERERTQAERDSSTSISGAVVGHLSQLSSAFMTRPWASQRPQGRASSRSQPRPTEARNPARQQQRTSPSRPPTRSPDPRRQEVELTPMSRGTSPAHGQTERSPSRTRPEGRLTPPPPQHRSSASPNQQSRPSSGSSASSRGNGRRP